ncbi:MAG TPA: hypothetical protein VJA40_01255, partial [archaeon]|nr:hypothetical protein [archaeon]
CRQDCGACPPLPSCGDGACLLPETCATCPNDCGSCPLPYCGDSHCQGVLLGETCATCPSDCCSLCGDRVCDGAFYGETCATCPQDCGNCVTSCSSFNSLSCGSSCQDCTQTHGVGAVCNGGVCSCPPETTSCRDSLTGVRFCTAPRADPRNCGGCSALGSVPQGENCLDKQEVCYLGNCGVTACTTNSNCSALGTAYKCCGTAGTSVKACTNVNSQASVVNCGACGNACGQGGNAGRPFCCPSGGTYACSSAPCPPPI